MKKKILIFGIIVAIFVIGICFYLLYKNFNKNKNEVDKSKYSVPIFNVEDNYDETKEMILQYKSPNSNGSITIPLNISKCTQNLKYKIVIDLSEIYSDEKNHLYRVYFNDLDIVNNQVMKEGEIDLDAIEGDFANIKLDYTASEVTDVSTSEYEKEITIRVITEPANSVIDTTNKSKLVDVVQVGDYVNYDANSNGEQTYIYGKCTYSTSNRKLWRVFSVNKETGEILISATVAYNDFYADEGISNMINQINNIAAIYGKGKYADGGRSITIEDIEKNTTYDKTSYEKKEKDIYRK